ncbi:MAG: hypothetical protein KDK36_12010 [Leptospiraceae bacterium]|nr:hypothetical protein [Leptospiraceae bacterium]
MQNFQIKYLPIILLSVLINCKKKPFPAKTGDFEKDMEIRLKLACDKINECNSHLFRTFPVEGNEFSEDDCEKIALKNFKVSLPSYTDELKSLTLDCSERIIMGNCKKLISELLAAPSCYSLRGEVEKVRSREK